MKIISTPIEVLAWFELNGKPHPVRMKFNDKEIKIEQVISIKEEDGRQLDAAFQVPERNWRGAATV